MGGKPRRKAAINDLVSVMEIGPYRVTVMDVPGAGITACIGKRVEGRLPRTCEFVRGMAAEVLHHLLRQAEAQRDIESL